ncbi:MAG: putative cytochrome [Gammaproteobacteria bacterium]|nr:putative cytochrome [Gammaproteobacteria bacterium]
MTSDDAADWFTNQALVDDPFPYYESLRAKGPVVREQHHAVVVVTGYLEALAVYRDDERFSSINAPSGPIPPLPFTPDPYDIGPQIEHYRDQIIYSDWLVTRDRPAHTASRSLHLSFSRGIHSCVGAPLARAEGFICLQRLFDQTEDFRVSEAKHGPAGERRYSYEPTYLLRGMRELHLDIQPRSGVVPSPRAA